VIISKVSRLKGIYRVGLHNRDTISIIFGSLLGNAHIEKRLIEVGTSITFYQEAVHIEYLLHLHTILSGSGYCNTNLPNITTRLGPKGKIRKVIRFAT
jgi:hypothetical protein